MTNEITTPKYIGVDLATKPDEIVTTIPFRPLFKTTDLTSPALQLRVPDQRLSEVTTTYWRYFMSQIRCEVRLSFSAIAVRVQIILPTGQRSNFHYRYETKLSFIVAQLMTFANYETGA